MNPTKTPYSTHTVLFFDGVCGLCNSAVDFLLRADKHRKLHFAPLQGDTAAELIPELVQNIETIVLLRKGKVYMKSAAVLRIAHILGGFWHLAGILWPLQPLIGDWVYNGIAKNRYKWFGKHETCRMPTPEERAVFMP
jgi:predicted DCC family thiol-disulfide oxidoreductase YuxK